MHTIELIQTGMDAGLRRKQRDVFLSEIGDAARLVGPGVLQVNALTKAYNIDDGMYAISERAFADSPFSTRLSRLAEVFREASGGNPTAIYLDYEPEAGHGGERFLRFDRDPPMATTISLWLRLSAIRRQIPDVPVGLWAVPKHGRLGRLTHDQAVTVRHAIDALHVDAFFPTLYPRSSETGRAADVVRRVYEWWSGVLVDNSALYPCFQARVDHKRPLSEEECRARVNAIIEHFGRICIWMQAESEHHISYWHNLQTECGLYEVLKGYA